MSREIGKRRHEDLTEAECIILKQLRVKESYLQTQLRSLNLGIELAIEAADKSPQNRFAIEALLRVRDAAEASWDEAHRKLREAFPELDSPMGFGFV